MDDVSIDEMSEDDQKVLASVSMSMKMQKKEKEDLFHSSMLNLSNNGFNTSKYIDEIQKSGFDLDLVTMTFDDFENMKKWASKDWAKSWKGKLPSEIKDSDGNVIDFTDENINDLKAQLAMNTFNEMINFDQDELRGSIDDNIKEIATRHANTKRAALTGSSKIIEKIEKIAPKSKDGDDDIVDISL